MAFGFDTLTLTVKFHEGYIGRKELSEALRTLFRYASPDLSQRDLRQLALAQVHWQPAQTERDDDGD